MLREHHADGVLVPKLDRLTRRVVDLGLLIETYFAEGRWALASAADQIDTRTSPPRTGTRRGEYSEGRQLEALVGATVSKASDHRGLLSHLS